MSGGGGGRFGQYGGRGQTSSRVSITIENSEGKLVSRVNGTENKGINRIYWNFREQTSQRQQAGRGGGGFRGGGGLTALPGEYTVKIKYDDEEVSQSFTVKSDPRMDVDLAVLKDNYAMAKQGQKLSTALSSVQTQLEETQKAITTVQEYARSNRLQNTHELIGAARDLDKKLKELSEILSPTPAKQGISDRSAGLSSYVRAAAFRRSSGNEPVSQAAKVKYEKAKVRLEAFLEKFNNVFQTDVENFKKKVEESGFTLFKAFKPLKLEE